MSLTLLRIATRKSPLALWQAHAIADLLQTHWPTLTIEFVPLQTTGDRFLNDKLLAVGGKGLFVKELEEALLDGRADIAVHSMKDVPVELPSALKLAIISQREDARDALLSLSKENLADLPLGATLGTASLRRQAQLLALRPDLHIVPLRGNIQTRIDKLKHGEFDAIVLAHAGLQRMSLTQHVKQVFSPDLLLPACGQGALGIECRANDPAVLKFIAPLHDTNAALCVNSERLVNARLGGNCHVPLAVFCEFTDATTIRLRAKVFTPDGKIVISNHQQGTAEQAIQLAEACANELLDHGAAALLAMP